MQDSSLSSQMKVVGDSSPARSVSEELLGLPATKQSSDVMMYLGGGGGDRNPWTIPLDPLLVYLRT